MFHRKLHRIINEHFKIIGGWGTPICNFVSILHSISIRVKMSHAKFHQNQIINEDLNKMLGVRGTKTSFFRTVGIIFEKQ